MSYPALPYPVLPYPVLPYPALPYPLICSAMLFFTCPFQHSTSTATSPITATAATATTGIAIFSFPPLDNRSEEPYLILMLCHLMPRHFRPIRQPYFIAFLQLHHHLAHSLYPNLHLYFKHFPPPPHVPPTPLYQRHLTHSISLPTPQLPSDWP